MDCFHCIDLECLYGFLQDCTCYTLECVTHTAPADHGLLMHLLGGLVCLGSITGYFLDSNGHSSHHDKIALGELHMASHPQLVSFSIFFSCLIAGSEQILS